MKKKYAERRFAFFLRHLAITDKCKENCCKVNYCSLLAISGIVGCFAPFAFPIGQITLADIKSILIKFGASNILKFLGRLGC